MAGRRIDVLARDGSPLGVTEKTLSGEDGRMGVGGAELAILTLCRAWQFYGNDVTFYNDPKEGGASSFRQLPIASFDPNEERDILIIFRSPNPLASISKGKKIWFSCDSYTIDDFRAFRSQVEKVVCISQHHANYFKQMYGIHDAIPIDLPVRTWEYQRPVQKIPKRCIFTSIPDRGVMELQSTWARIVAEIPEASLVITSDWRLWVDWASEEQIRNYRLGYARLPNVTYRGAVKRDELIKIQQEAEIHLYPCIFEEQFCISVAESQVAGVFPLTSDAGALATTNMGWKITGNPQNSDWQNVFVAKAVELLTDPKLQQKQEWIREVSKNRFSIENVLRQWEERVFC